MKAKKRQISAWMLLAVILPMLVFSSFHIHESLQTTDAECSDCVHHNCHGHLTATAAWAHACVLCQFLTLSMVTAAVVAVTVYIHVCQQRCAQPLYGYHTKSCGIIVTRGPPSA